MNPSRPAQQHADAVHSGAFTGNLQRASLLPGEIAARAPVSQEIRAAAGTGGYPQPAGASLYQRQNFGSPLIQNAERPWWHWPAITALVTLSFYGLQLVMSDSSSSGDLLLMLQRLMGTSGS